MKNSNCKHLTKDQRDAIELALAEKSSARKIARMISVSASTVTREVKANRVVKERRGRKGANLAVRCSKYGECQLAGKACAKCSSRLTACRHCRTRSCIDSCPEYERRMCPETERWPYVCAPECPKRAHCGYPLCSYDADKAQAAYEARLSESRAGVAVTEGELEAIGGIVAPLVRKGQSFEAICATHGGEIPVCARTLYNYQERGLLGTANIELPRKVRVRPRRKARAEPGRDRVDREGRTHDDFLALPPEDLARVVQGDSVEGREGDAHDLLSLYLVARRFHLYLRKEHASSGAVVGWLDAIEASMGSREEFEEAFGVMLVDRGVEFDDWEGMERSCLEPGRRRCRVFYCDPMESNQKSECERDHEQLRRILPKGRTDMDALGAWDAAVITSHVNSYPLGGKTGFERLGSYLPQRLLDDLGVAPLHPDDVVLRPSLMAHAVEQ